jgi:hypothetical protein
MTRRIVKRRPAPISLFSFLDILGGTIGVLTLIIAVFLIQMTRGNQIVQMVSEGQQFQDRIASYIICNGDGYVELHDGGTPQSTTINSAIVSKFLRELKSDPNRYLILGVRPKGFDDFERLRNRAESLNIQVGYEPLDDGWRIRAPGGELL